MTRVLGAILLGVLLTALPVAAQPGVEITTPPPGRETPLARPDAATGTPTDGGSVVPGPYVPYAPVFLGPTVKTRTGEYGVSLWLAPAAGDRDVSGWAAIGFTFTWGGPPYRLPDPSAR